MIRMFQIIIKLFAYKEPKNLELGFELLEETAKGIELETPEPNIQQISKLYEEDSKYRKTSKRRQLRKTSLSSEPRKEMPEGELSPELQVNINYLQQRFNLPQNNDIVIRKFNIARQINACLLFVGGMADGKIINQFILPPLMNADNFKDLKESDILSHITKNVLSIDQITKTKNLDGIVKQVLTGITALIIDGSQECLLIESRGFEKRNVDKPQTETVIRGSQEAFIENMETNLTLVRRIIKNENLIAEIIQISKTNQANCAMLYLKGIANPALIQEVRNRLTSLNTDFIKGEGMLEQFIEDNPFMPFPQVMETERPDRAASFLMDGKVVLITEGAPFAMAVPITFFHLLHTSEDFALRWQYAAFLRLIRIGGLLLALLLPGLYLALTLYHHEMIPTQLLITIVDTREKVPFPAVIEMLMLGLSFELIREGGIRVPGVIGNTLGIVGALILGEAAVAAGLVGPIMIIIVAVTGIGSFVIPNYSLSLGIRISRFAIVFLGALAGFYGVALSVVGLGLLTCSMKSFGVPFLAPIAPKTMSNRDDILRQPIWLLEKRIDVSNTPNRQRQGNIARGWLKGKSGGEK